MNLKWGKKFFPLTYGEKNGDFSDHSERRIFGFLRIFKIVKVVIFFPLCQREKLFPYLTFIKAFVWGARQYILKH